MSLTNRFDFVLLFDVKDGNPNGDPDAGNLPRMDAETGNGLVTDVSLKRKVRNFVSLVHPEVDDASGRFSEIGSQSSRHHIFIREKGVLNQEIEKAYSMSSAVKEGLDGWNKWKKDKKKAKPARHYEDLARDWMCHNFYDIRAFGAVMTTGDKQDSEAGDSQLRKTAGQVRGPVQLTFARSIDPIVALEHSITRMAVTNEKDSEKERTMGRKHTVPYGLYVAHGFVSSFLAKQTGFSEPDLELFWRALCEMFEHDRSAARGEMTTRGLYVFKHESSLGNAPAHTLFERIRTKLKDGVSVPRSFDDYDVAVDDARLPTGVTLIKKC
ncbi:MAG: type I-C CRISPR-associated protein Cas7/Csd2 [Verrucomicrobia bacterium]|nr:type I-C CRISPR-associated protein Cas7/Csd2 [Verrucomicrobiota bacterium]